MSSTFTFDNCHDCGQYAKLNHEMRCKDCLAEEQIQINTALELVQMKTDITLDEIAHALDVEDCRVLEWVRKGLVRCIVIEFECPNCHIYVKNRLSCPSCGFDKHAFHETASVEDISCRMVTLDRRRPARYTSYSQRTKLSA